MSYTYVVEMNDKEIYRFHLSVPLNEEQLECFNLWVHPLDYPINPHHNTETIVGVSS
jgi:hypothetical protein